MGAEVNPMLGGLVLGAALAARQKGGQPAPSTPAPAPRAAQRVDPTAAMQSMVQDAQAQGLGTTWLTGPQGVDPKTLSTEKKRLSGSLY